MRQPNILWLIAEDMCPNLGCYKDVDAITPNLDQLASEGLRYDMVTSCGPVCSAARTTLALGMFPPSVGTGNHRSHVKLPSNIKLFAQYMQEAGYFTAINKTDYNFQVEYDNHGMKGWDIEFDAKYFEDSADVPAAIQRAWKNRDDKPFFFMNTFAVTHQSKYGFPNKPEKHREMFIPRTKPKDYRDRNKLHIPAYHPDNKDTREIWGQYHECVTAMDRMVGETIEHLKADGLYEDTIIFFFGDNGMGIPSGKFNMWNEGTDVPLIVRVPDKYRHLTTVYDIGAVSHRAVTFIDFAPTALKLAEAEIPNYMQGESFLNPDNDKVPNVNFSYRNRIDSSCELVRSVRNQQYLYIRNFYPQKGWRYSPYIAISSPYFMASWDKEVGECQDDIRTYNRLKAFNMSKKPIEELYDLVNDKDQMNNLAYKQEYNEQLLFMRQEVHKNMIDLTDGGLIPEQVLKKMATGTTAYEVIHNKELYPLKDILDICNKMLDEEVKAEDYYTYLHADNPIIRYWGVQGIYAVGIYNRIIASKLKELLKDESVAVSLAAAETIIALTLDETDIVQAKEVLIDCLNCETDVLIPLETIDCMDRLGKSVKDLIPFTKRLLDMKAISQEKDADRYLHAVYSMSKLYAEKMGVPHEYNDDDIKFNERLYEFRRLNSL